MARNWIKLKPCLLTAFILGVCCAVFFLVSRVDLPADFIRAMSGFGWVHFLVLSFLLYLILSIQGRMAYWLGGLFTALVFAIPLALRLSTGLSNATVLAGFLPYKDGFYYYNGANMLLSGNLIPASGLQGAFRPLFPALLSSLLLLSGQNLIVALQLMVLATGSSLYLAALAVRRSFGAIPAAVFYTLVFAFIRPMLGDTLTELPGLAFACLALVLLLEAGRTKRNWAAALGGIMLVLALSIRAGAFFMLPVLILWWGWLNRGEKWRAWKKMILLGLILVAAFVLFNSLIPHMLVAAGESTFGNFSWMLYGQAVGGAGFKYHAEALGTSDSAVVLQAALEKIRSYPQGFLIGCAKAYRDFFYNNSLGMFDLMSGGKTPGGWLFWGACLILLLSGLVRAFRQHRRAENMLLLASFAGVLLSIPFLPPIDGGNRFYAGSVPFLFALMASALPDNHLAIMRKKNESGNLSQQEGSAGLLFGSAGYSILMLLLTLLLPHILSWKTIPASPQVSCDPGELAYTTRIVEGTYVDILPNEGDTCGGSPQLCVSRFIGNGMDKANDDFYRLLSGIVQQSDSGIRLWAGVEQNTGEYYFWAAPLGTGDPIPDELAISGCAELIESQYQRLLWVNTISLP